MTSPEFLLSLLFQQPYPCFLTALPQLGLQLQILCLPCTTKRRKRFSTININYNLVSGIYFPVIEVRRKCQWEDQIQGVGSKRCSESSMQGNFSTWTTGRTKSHGLNWSMQILSYRESDSLGYTKHFPALKQMSHHNSTNSPPFNCIMASCTHGHVTMIQKYKGKAPFGCVKQALNLLFFVTAKACRSPENKEEN